MEQRYIKQWRTAEHKRVTVHYLTPEEVTMFHDALLKNYQDMAREGLLGQLLNPSQNFDDISAAIAHYERLGDDAGGILDGR